MTVITRTIFALASLLLCLLALALVGLGLREMAGAFTASEDGSADAVLDTLGYVIVAIAVFDVAKYLFEDEVRRGAEKRSAAEARRSLTKFLTTIIIALFLEGLVQVFKLSREDPALTIYPTALIGVSILTLIGLGIFQRLSAAVEERVGDEDEAEAEEEARTPRKRSPRAAKS